ncbi:uncharacterized protein LOC114525153 [Dendronephthya gigantea]|uniref:uncharacterized protein LOC114525153 n=1 Tax=Dendronephthya gigantea TaxID=151771 RepID=UPI00106D7A5E|nr:uncharacterized protein LOC114525153 [Dendronephthya gigantea]
MANLPVIHELGTSFLSLGDVITGDPEKARERWKTYAEESVIGSCVAATVEAAKGNEEKSKEYLKGMGRATGKAVLGGGLLKDVPGFHELAVCGESLGDMIGGGDDESARERWKTYSESSVIGSGLGALAAKIDGDDEKAERLTEACGKAGKRFGVTAATVTAVVASGGLAAAHGVAAAAGGVIVGGAAGVGSTAAMQMIDNDKIDDPGAVVGMGLMVAVSGHMPEVEKPGTPQKVTPNSSEEASKSSEENRNSSEEVIKTMKSPEDTPNIHEDTSTSSDEKNPKKPFEISEERGFEGVQKTTKSAEELRKLIKKFLEALTGQ